MQIMMRPLVRILSLLVVLSPAAFAQSALERVQKTGELRVGTDATYPPFERSEGNKLEGFDIDLVSAIARQMGVRATFINFAFDGLQSGLETGNFDIVISAYTITPERSQKMLFTDPYAVAGQMIAVKRETTNIEKPEDLNGKRVGVQRTTTAHRDLEQRNLSGAGIDIHELDSIDLALLELHNQRIDAVVGDAPTLSWMIDRRQSFRNLKTVGRRFTNEKLGIALALESDDLRRAVNAALFHLVISGEYTKIYDKWLNDSATSSIAETPDGASGKLFDVGIIRHTWTLFLTGAWLTGRLTILALLLGLPIGLLLALSRIQSLKAIAMTATLYIETVRGTPLLVQILFIYFFLPRLDIYLPAFTAGVIALTLNSAAYIAEIFRAGILSIGAGQVEAARSLGMTQAQAMRRIILPQAFRRVVPPITNEAIALLKDSSLVSVIGLIELARTGQQLASTYAAPLTIWPIVAIFYLMLTFPLTRASQYLERHWQSA